MTITAEAKVIPDASIVDAAWDAGVKTRRYVITSRVTGIDVPDCWDRVSAHGTSFLLVERNREQLDLLDPRFRVANSKPEHESEPELDNESESEGGTDEDEVSFKELIQAREAVAQDVARQLRPAASQRAVQRQR